MTEIQALTDEQTFTPDWISAPGETIEDLLEERSWTQAELADRIGFTRKHVNDLVKGRVSITPDAAIRLETVLGSSADFWLRREAHYREALERRLFRERLKGEAGWLRELPLNQMVKFGWVRRASSSDERVANCLRFFGVASVAAWRRQYEAPVAALCVPGKVQMRVGAVTAWLRQGERQATALRCAPYAKADFKASLGELRSLTQEQEPKVFVPRLVEVCASRGLAVVFVPTPGGCPAKGATRWLSPEKAMLILSLRHRTNDHLWLTFFHSVAHLLLHSKKQQFVDLVDGSNGKQEEEADRFARDWLIPPPAARHLETLGRSGRIPDEAVSRFAAEVGVAPGIVVERMQKEGWLPKSHLNGLRVGFAWKGV